MLVGESGERARGPDLNDVVHNYRGRILSAVYTLAVQIPNFN